MENRTIKHVILYSGGASSAYVAKWVVDKYGKENSILLFTDTLWEDDDNYRFLEECAAYIGIEITRRVDGRTPEEVFFGERFLGNARVAQCSEELKVKQTLIFIEDLRMKNIEPILYFGIDAKEKHRADSLTWHYEHLPLEPVECRFPMIDSISGDVKAKQIIANEWKIKLPRMYDLGFHHANCAGRCVRGGLHHYANLYLVWPDKYKLQEEMEERFRSEFNMDVSIMKKNGKPYTLKKHRETVLEKMSLDELKDYAKTKDDESIPCFCSFS
jgi:3'-phosphoadenosine 5'-phosphosulfate sulfotransferase (PAPS reductase)/FAD synthetase